MFIVHNLQTLHAPGVDPPDDTTYATVKAWATALGADQTVFSVAGELVSVEVLGAGELDPAIKAEVRHLVLISVADGTCWPILCSGIAEALDVVNKAAPLLSLGGA